MPKKLAGSWSDWYFELWVKNLQRGVKICNSNDLFFFLIWLTHFRLMAVRVILTLDGWRINVLFTPWRVDDRYSMSIGDLSHIFHFGLHFRSNLKGSLMGWEVKNLLSCQSKHGLVGSSAKTRHFLSRESQEWKTCTFLGPKHKSAIWDGTLPTYTSNVVYMCGGGLMGHKSSIGIQLSRFVHVL